MGNFQDCDIGTIDSLRSYIARCYEGKIELFYKDVEDGNVPVSSAAYYRFYNPTTHVALLLPRVLKALKDKV